MFTGIVEETGVIKRVQRGLMSCVLTIQGNLIFDDIHWGDSIAVNGVCLTVTGFAKNTFTADVMHETLKKSSLNLLNPGDHVNLERAMKANGRFGGHIVSGHIDGTGTIAKIEKDDNAIWYTIETSEKVMKYIVEKGSIAIDGISLTVARVASGSFSVSVIPHTAMVTILCESAIGDIVNLENDVIGKYVEKLMGFENSQTEQSKISKEFLFKYGY